MVSIHQLSISSPRIIWFSWIIKEFSRKRSYQCIRDRDTCFLCPIIWHSESSILLSKLRYSSMNDREYSKVAVDFSEMIVRIQLLKNENKTKLNAHQVESDHCDFWSPPVLKTGRSTSHAQTCTRSWVGQHTLTNAATSQSIKTIRSEGYRVANSTSVMLSQRTSCAWSWRLVYSHALYFRNETNSWNGDNFLCRCWILEMVSYSSSIVRLFLFQSMTLTSRRS